jgi:hypothetical protein
MKKNIFYRELLAPLGLATGKAKYAAKILTSNQQQTLRGHEFEDLLELLSLLEARAMVQPNKVDFDVRKVLDRKEVSRDWMALSEHHGAPDAARY